MCLRAKFNGSKEVRGRRVIEGIIPNFQGKLNVMSDDTHFMSDFRGDLPLHIKQLYPRTVKIALLWLAS